MLAASVACATAVDAGAQEALAYVRARQNADGGFSEPDVASDPRTTCWAVLSGASAGEDSMAWTKGGTGPEQYLAGAAASVTSLEDIELMTLALAEGGSDPTDVSGKDLVSLISASADGNGKIGADIKEHCWGIIALSAAGESLPPSATEWLVGQQRADGGWGVSDQVVVQDTALAIEALTAAGESTTDETDSALRFMQGRINGDGGFKGASQNSDVQTTSTVVRAIYAAGDDPESDSWSFHGNTPVGFLQSLQAADGHFQFSKGVESQPAMTTAMAVPAISASFFPLTSGNADNSSDTTGEAGGQADLGTAGAGMSLSGTQGTVGPGQGVQVNVQQGFLSGVTGSARGALNLWIFLVSCGIYAGLLLVVVVVVSVMSRPRPRPRPPAMW